MKADCTSILGVPQASRRLKNLLAANRAVWDQVSVSMWANQGKYTIGFLDIDDQALNLGTIGGFS